jgi:hypothetical protein
MIDALTKIETCSFYYPGDLWASLARGPAEFLAAFAEERSIDPHIERRRQYQHF